MPKPADWKGSDLRSRAEVALWLKNHNGEVHDPTGLIVGRMRTELGKGRALSQLLADMETDGMIKREVRGRRTLMIKLLDDWGLADDLSAQPVFRPPAAAHTDGDGTDLSNVDLDALAQRLLLLVVSQTRSNASEAADISRTKQQLADIKAERDELRDQLIIARESEAEQRRQAESMRESLAKLQASMDRAPAKGGTPLREQLRPADRKLLDRLMREVPSNR